jgi:outer membrane protein OmpA-like peptidoglycan-associated protein
VGTDSDGRFLTHELGAGAVTLEAQRPGYEPAAADARVEAGQVATLELAIKAKPAEPPPAQPLPPPPPPPAPLAPPRPEQGWVTGRVEALFGKPAGAVRLENEGQSLETKLDADGRFALRAPVGAYEVVVLPEKHIAARSKVDVTADALAAPVLRLYPRPAAPPLKVVDDRAVPSAPFRLDEKKPEPAAADKAVLLALADLVNLDGNVRLSIQVHADAPAKPGDDRKQWTEERAKAIREALIGFGASPDRVEAKGLGLEQPLVPSLSPKRAKNRRVEFVLTKGQPTPAPVPTPVPAPAAPVVPATPADAQTPELE